MSIIAEILKLFVGSKVEKDRKELEPYVEKVRAIYPSIAKLSDDDLRSRITAMRNEIEDAIGDLKSQIDTLKAEMDGDIDVSQKEKNATKIDVLEKEQLEIIEAQLIVMLPEVFAIVKDTARRFTENATIEVFATDFDRNLAAEHDFVEIDGDKAIYKNEWTAGGNLIKWDMIHYDVQLFGGTAMHTGKIAEMGTGEGKTLVATLPVFLNAMSGRGVHVVTVNDYLSRRDSEWMGPIYMFHGLSVDCIDKHQPNSDARRKAYNCDITFGTNNEFGFDYLRDNMAIDKADLVQRKHHYAIVDEVDSVLIDDARTPLIISGPVPKGEDQLFNEYKPSVENLYNLQKTLCSQLLIEAKKLIAAGDTEKGGIALYRSNKGLPKSKPLIKFLSEPGMKSLMMKTENVYMSDNNKRMPEITDDLYFVIDERNNSIEMTDKGHDTLSKRFDDPRFFVLPDIGATIASLEHSDKSVQERVTAKDQLLAEYAVKTERVHTVNQLLKAYSLFENNTEYIVADNKVKIVDEQTGRVLDGRRYSDGLHQAIEAKENVKVEAATQTFATVTLQNYFRMYHKLSGMTGTAETEAGEFWNIYKLDVVVIPTNRPIVRDDRQDLVYKTVREKYSAVIEEINKLVQAGRPVLVGTTSVEISELLSRALKLRGIQHNVLNAKQHQSEAMIVAEAGKAGQVTIATNMAGRGTDIKLSAEVKASGGLAIVGTERHESRRVDRQLRGRAGRQGDPGSSQFFVSFEDNLMRLFGGDRMSRIMDSMWKTEGESLQSSMVTKAIERAQKKVEENNFGMRKRLLEYDDVMNSQREVVYSRRRHALYGERIEVDLLNMIHDHASALVDNFRANDFEAFKLEIISALGIEPTCSEKEYNDLNDRQLVEILVNDMMRTYKRRMDVIGQTAFGVIEKVFKEQGEVYNNISIPITDGRKGINVSVNLKKAYESNGAEIGKALSRILILITIDEFWKEHLRDMDDLKQSVQNATYEQKDPLLIYKFESFGLFKDMLDKVNGQVLSMLMKATLPIAEPSPQREEPRRQAVDMSKMQMSRNEAAALAGQGEKQKPAPVHVEKQIGRNDQCPCGSGQKYKNCHGKN